MDILLDTHILLWSINDDPRLTEKAKNLIFSKDNTLYYSIISMWEVAIKHMKNQAALGTVYYGA
ncbi:MAG: hypothetical protein IIX47_02170 [Spirochaetaceae bacterium]|nr:hypothetical protein [Spirochaetaceae bacterium]